MKNTGKLILVSLILTTLVSCTYTENDTDNVIDEKINTGAVVELDTETNTEENIDKEVDAISEDIEVLNKSENISELKDGDLIATMVTSKGDIKIKLFPETAPKTVTNFLVHAQEGYYDNLIFHRVIDNFMIQGGDPLGTGTGGDSIYGPTFEDEFFGNVENNAGTIAMANSGPNTNGSQFFINERANNHLDNVHTVFGQVIEGMDVVDKITQVPMDESTSKPVIDIVIEEVNLFQYHETKFIKYVISDTEVVKKDAQEKYNELMGEKENQVLAEQAKIEEIRNKKIAADIDRIAQSNDEVSVKYRLTLDDGTVVDGNFDSDSLLTFVIDAGQMIPGFNDAVKGSKIGEMQVIKIPAEEAYGGETVEVKMSDLQQFIDNGITIAIGEKIEIGNGISIDIIDIQGDIVTITNPEKFAGKDLNFEIELKYFVN